MSHRCPGSGSGVNQIGNPGRGPCGQVPPPPGEGSAQPGHAYLKEGSPDWMLLRVKAANQFSQPQDPLVVATEQVSVKLKHGPDGWRLHPPLP